MTPQERAKAVSAAELMVRRVVREELRRCGIRPPKPNAYGVWVWRDAEDQWVEQPEKTEVAHGAGRE